MKKITFLSAAKAVFTLFIFAGILTACSNSTSSDDHEQEPVGFAIYQGNTLLVSQNSSGSMSGEITVEASASTDLRIAFIDEDDEVFTPEKDEHSMSFEAINGSGEISISQEDASNQPFLFTLNGISEGEASFNFSLLHVGAEEFGPATVPVTVTASN